MQSFQALATVALPTVDASLMENSTAAPNQSASTTLRTAIARVVSFFDLRAQLERSIGDKYACHSWCDSTERRISHELMGSNKFAL